MKIPHGLHAVLALAALACPIQAADKVSTMPIENALKIAQNYLKGKEGKPVMVSLTLERSAVVGESYWYAQWAAPIIGRGKPELGLKISMEGGLTKIVSPARR